MKTYIGVMDSGKGGLSVLEELKRVLPNENYIYYGDRCNNPYGSKSDEELLSITQNIVENFIKRGCKVIVVACNTATVRCIEKLKKLYPNIIFVGTVPAVKVAYDAGCRNTLVLATPTTIKSERTNELVTEFKRSNQNIYLESCSNLASSIEEDDEKEIDNILKDIYNKYKSKDIDSIVLGCTHYSLIKSTIKEVFGNVLLFDGNLGVAKEVRRKLIKYDLLNNGEGSVKILKNL